MDQNRILTIGVSQKTLRSGSLFDPPNFNEFDTVIWNPPATIESLSNVSFSVSYVLALQRNLARIIEWVSQGHTLIVIAIPIKNFTYQEGGAQKSVQINQSEPFIGISFERATGKLVEWAGPSSFHDAIKPSLHLLHYEAVLQSTTIAPLFKVSKGRHGTNQVLGGYKRIGNGFVVFVPPITGDLGESPLIKYYTALSLLPDQLVAREHAGDLPDWANGYQLDAEKAARKRIAEIENQISDLRQKSDEQQSAVQSAQELKQLFVGTGDAFAAAVADALRELGLTVVEGPRYRADLIAFEGRRIAALEVKGLESAARETNLRQTERWVADIRSALTASTDLRAADSDLNAYAEKLSELGVPPDSADIECKGIMVIGTHRKTPLDDRTEPSFPDPVARTINRSAVCALSGLQLLGLLLDSRKNEAAKSEIIQYLFATNGVVDRATDWRSFLTKR